MQWSRHQMFALPILSLFLALQSTVFAQNQNNNWFFGRQAGISKTSNGVSILQNSRINALEACGSVSSFTTGELLFYTNGVSVWDSTNSIMPNGDSLNGGISCAQGALILPHFKEPNKYLVFTTPEFRNADNSMYYSVVDMTLRNGLGDVEPQNKNIAIIDSVCEGLTYSYNRDSSGYWLITRERKSNRFISILVDSSGVGSKIVYSRFIGNRTGNFSIITLSPNQKQIAVTNTSQSYIEFYDFDNCTGKLNNRLAIGGIDIANYGAAFSPNNNIFYLTTSFELNNQKSELLQFDLSSGDSATIRNSMVLLGRPTLRFNSVVYFGNLQLHADDKIYVAEIGNKELSVIENPDVYGAGTIYSKNKISLQGGTSNYGLPQLVPQRLKLPKFITTQGGILISDSCIEDSVRFTVNGINSIDELVWTLSSNSGVITQGSQTSIAIKIDAVGSYTFQAIATVGCDKYLVRRTFTMQNCLCEGEITVSDTCKDELIDFGIVTDDGIDAITWEFYDANGNLLSTSNQLTQQKLFSSIQTVRVRAIVVFDCGDDTLERIISIGDCDCSILIPNAFTPNSDGVNEAFGVETNCALPKYSFNIYNRWGERIFSSIEPAQKWDGTYKKRACQAGVYFYTLTYLDQNGDTKSTSGNITLMY